MSLNPDLYGLLVEFDSADALIAAARQVHAAGYRKVDAFSPYPLKEAAEALEQRRTWVPAIVLFGGLTGCVGGFLMQYWLAVFDDPIDVGGRPLNSWPSFIPITFEMTVLFATLFGFVGLLAMCGLPRLYHPVFNVPNFAAASRDRFFLCVESADPRFDLPSSRQFLEGLGATAVLEVPQ